MRFSKYQKSDKAPFIIYVDLENLMEKIDECKNHPENSSTTNVDEQIPSGFSMTTISSCKSTGNNHNVYRGKDCMRKFCDSLGDPAWR